MPGSSLAQESLPGPAAAASTPISSPSSYERSYWTFPDLVAAAIAQHPSVAMKRLEQEAAGSLRLAAKLQFLPTPSIGVDSLRGDRATVFRLTQPLWTGGRLTADLNAAELKRLRADEAVNEASLTLALRVATLYQGFLLQSGRIESQLRGIDKLEQLVTMIERRVGSGVSAQVDFDLARARLSQARSDLVALQNARRTVLAQLSQAVGHPLQADEVLVESFSTQQAAAYQGVAREPLPSVIDRALASSPTLKLSEIDVRLARNEVVQTRAQLWPTVQLRAEHQDGSYAGSLGAGNRVYISLQYTPGAGAAVIPQAAAAQSRANAAEQVVFATRRDLSDKVEAEWLDFQSASTRIAELERTRMGTADVLESSVRLFVTGRRTWLDLLNSVRELMQTEQLEVDAQATARGASHRLGLLTGSTLWSNDGGNP